MAWLEPIFHEIRRSVGSENHWYRPLTQPHSQTLLAPSKRSRKEWRLVSWTQTMHKSYFSAFFAYIEFQVANIFNSIYWPLELITWIYAGSLSWNLEGFQIFEIRQTLECSWCMILSRQSLSLLYDNNGMCSSFPFILQVQTKCL